MEKKKVIGFYNYTVILTYIGMLFAFVGILASIRNDFTTAIICLMFAGICDMFDGLVASTRERNSYEKHFGIEIDSMCDLVSFGVMPAIFVYMNLHGDTLTTLLTAIYVLCALIRLSYFNVQELDRQHNEEGHREIYLGVPVTVIAVVLPIFFVVEGVTEYFVPGISLNAVYRAIMMIFSVGFVSGIELHKPKKSGKLALVIIGIGMFVLIFVLSGTGIL